MYSVECGTLLACSSVMIHACESSQSAGVDSESIARWLTFRRVSFPEVVSERGTPLPAIHRRRCTAMRELDLRFSEQSRVVLSPTARGVESAARVCAQSGHQPDVAEHRRQMAAIRTPDMYATLRLKLPKTNLTCFPIASLYPHFPPSPPNYPRTRRHSCPPQ